MLVSTPVRTVPRFDRIAFAQAASPASSRAARVVPWAAVSLFYVFLEDARLFLAVVICVARTSQKLHDVNLAQGVASMAWILTRVD